MWAVILAAGRGTRMGAPTAHTPKPLLHLKGRPIIEHILTGLRAAGVAMLDDGRTVRACAARGFWSDLGTPEDLADAEHAFA